MQHRIVRRLGATNFLVRAEEVPDAHPAKLKRNPAQVEHLLSRIHLGATCLIRVPVLDGPPYILNLHGKFA